MLAALFAISFIDDPAPPLLPDGRHGHRVERYGRAWISIGGFALGRADDRGMRDTFVANSGGTWKKGPRLPVGKAFFASVEWRGSVYAIGGTVEVLGPGSSAWRTLKAGGELPETHLSAARLGSRAYVLGGYPGKFGSFRSVDLKTGKLRIEPAMPEFKPNDHFFILVNLGEKLHAIGGLAGDKFEPSRRHFIFDGKTWTIGAPPPNPQWAKMSAVASDGSKVWILGDEASVSFDSRTGRWKELARMPESLAMPAAVVVDGKVVVLGGQADDDPGRRIRWTYDPSSDRWLR